MKENAICGERRKEREKERGEARERRGGGEGLKSWSTSVPVDTALG